jgi:hypothetical protein
LRATAIVGARLGGRRVAVVGGRAFRSCAVAVLIGRLRRLGRALAREQIEIA